jgi:hypothetical protein
MTLAPPMFPPRAETSPVNELIPPRVTAAQIARRGLLRAFATLAPAVALTTATASVPVLAAPQPRENRRLLWLGEKLDASLDELGRAVNQRESARIAALRVWPEPPAEIAFLPQLGGHPPYWCATQPERDIDDRDVLYYGSDGKARQRAIADPYQLETFLTLRCPRGSADFKNRKPARKMLAIAREYEAARERVIEQSGYGAARHALWNASRRTERLAALVFKKRSHTIEGVKIKASALIAAILCGNYDGLDGHGAYPSRSAGASSTNWESRPSQHRKSGAEQIIRSHRNPRRSDQAANLPLDNIGQKAG